MPSPKSAAKANSGGGPVKTPQLCKVRYGYTDWVLPVDKGLALVALLKDAVPVHYQNEGKAGARYKGEELAELGLDLLKPGQFVPAGPTLH